MIRRTTPGKERKIIFDEDISDRMDMVLATSRQTLSGFVQDAVVQRLARWEPAGAFIDRKRKKLGHGQQSGFDATRCHPSGWPLQLPQEFWGGQIPEDEIANLKALLESGSSSVSRHVIEQAWKAAGLGVYSNMEWKMTQEWYRNEIAQQAAQ